MSKQGAEYIGSRLKRSLDIYGGLALAACLIPPTAVAAAANMIDRRTTNPIFKQQRLGRNGQPLMVRKLETLREIDHTTFLAGGSHHPGASRLGLLLRKSSMDEVPQLASVIKGDISLVGIRPIAQAQREHYESAIPQETLSEWEEIYSLNLGLTGVGQLYSKRFPVHTPKVLRRRVELEIAAFENASFTGDLRVIAATPVVLMSHVMNLARLEQAPENI